MRIEAQDQRVERPFGGLGVSRGVAFGPVYVVEGPFAAVAVRRLDASAVPLEKRRFAAAVVRSGRQLRRLKAKARALGSAAGEEFDCLIDAYLQMLTGSRLLRGVERRIEVESLNAEAAVHAEILDLARAFAALPDPYMAARAADVREAGARLIRNLTKKPERTLEAVPPGSIIIAEEVSPADAALMAPERVAGFATALGGAEGHTAILARALGIPAVLGGGERLAEAAQTARTAIVDGVNGRVILDPTAETLAEYGRRRTAFAEELRRFARLRGLPATTRDGTAIELLANIDLPVELQAAHEHGAGGIGLLRTEFMFMNRESPPGEEEQCEALRAVVVAMKGRPVTIRTLDVGGEKLTYYLASSATAPVNPALGVRAIRLSLRNRKLFEDQLAAILRAAEFGPIRILLPLISTRGEVRQVRDILRRVARRLKRRGAFVPDPLPPLGAMIEVPGAALSADGLAAEADFFAIGTNDLTMYTLAIDRADDQVAHLYNPLHPAVLRLIQFTVQAALRARIPVSVCGELAGDPRYTPLLLGLGLRELSMTPGSLPRVKERIRSLDLTSATMRAQAIMEQADSGRIAILLDDFNATA